MKDGKSLIEFLIVLRNLTDSNIKFILKQDFADVPNLSKYKIEIESVQKLVNTFDFSNIDHIKNAFDLAQAVKLANQPIQQQQQAAMAG